MCRRWLIITTLCIMPIIFSLFYQTRSSIITRNSLSILFTKTTTAARMSSSSSSTFHHPQHKFPITLPEGLTQETVLNFNPFATWLSTLTHSLSLQSINPSHPFHSDPYTLRSITIQSYDLFGPRLGFLKLQSQITNSAGDFLPGAVFLRGPSVAMLVILIPDDVLDTKLTDERYVLLTVQPRVPAGSLEFVELPAGMVDDEGTFAGAAAKEIKEELGLVIEADELTDLSKLALSQKEEGGEGEGEGEGLAAAVYPSPGGCDEFIPIFMHEKKVPREQLKEWTGKLTGLREHGERITLKLVRMQDLWKEGGRDGKTLAAVTLWEGLRREGKV
ncbi:NUDIX family hydrolase [Podospora fimiseda]|uniref:NUDIX family hydrolase n=1 Tax=Podospora fimiseda TaxID=252190 RepID=A0AAN7BQ68_9PEZI|nr:NUDIX family hydrolase [Podospora fimiseda]